MKNDIKEIRNMYKFTQEELASHLGVSYTTVNRWETLKAKPSNKHKKVLDKMINNTKVKESNIEDISLRPIQYLGSKKRLLNDIIETINILVEPESVVCDLFSGSGVVSDAISKQHKVISVDIQKYSSVLVEALVSKMLIDDNYVDDFINSLEDNDVTVEFLEVFKPLIEYEEECLLKAKNGDGSHISEFIETCSVYKYINGNKKNIPVVIQRKLQDVVNNLSNLDSSLEKKLLISIYYGGIYFSFRQAILIDSILNQSNNIKNEKQKNEILAIVLSVASYIVNTVGKQFAQPIKLTDPQGNIKKLLIERTIRDRNISVQETFKKWHKEFMKNNILDTKNHEFFHIDYRDFLSSYKGNIDCFYADPPYTIDHYSRFYHVLETMSLYDFPKVDSRTRNGEEEYLRGMYRDDRHQSPFSISSKVRDGFRELFEGINNFSAPLILSYSPSNLDKNGRPRLLELSEIKTLAKEYFSHVYFIELKEHSHRKLNSSHRNTEIFNNAEIFIVCTYREVKKWKNI